MADSVDVDVVLLTVAAASAVRPLGRREGTHRCTVERFVLCTSSLVCITDNKQIRLDYCKSLTASLSAGAVVGQLVCYCHFNISRFSIYKLVPYTTSVKLFTAGNSYRVFVTLKVSCQLYAPVCGGFICCRTFVSIYCRDNGIMRRKSANYARRFSGLCM